MNGFIGGILLRVIGASVVWSSNQIAHSIFGSKKKSFNEILEPAHNSETQFSTNLVNLLIGIIVVLLVFVFIYVL